MSELSYKKLQEQGVFDVPYRAFEYMQSQQDKIDDLQAKYDELNNRATGIALDQMTTAKLNYELQGRNNEAVDYIAKSGGVNLTSEIALNDILKGNKDEV